jgi:hypothetical protein
MSVVLLMVCYVYIMFSSCTVGLMKNIMSSFTMLPWWDRNFVFKLSIVFVFLRVFFAKFSWKAFGKSFANLSANLL